MTKKQWDNCKEESKDEEEEIVEDKEGNYSGRKLMIVNDYRPTEDI